MTREEYKAAREEYRAEWSAEARRKQALARRNAIRFVWFLGCMMVVAFVLGAVKH